MSLLRNMFFDDGLNRPIQVAVGGNDYWYHVDLIGSVRALTDRVGNLIGQYEYDVFGVPLLVGVPHNPIRYAGRKVDAALGSYDSRGRQYDPILGRSLSATRSARRPSDVLGPVLRPPCSLHRPFRSRVRLDTSSINSYTLPTLISDDRQDEAIVSSPILNAEGVECSFTRMPTRPWKG